MIILIGAISTGAVPRPTNRDVPRQCLSPHQVQPIHSIVGTMFTSCPPVHLGAQPRKRANIAHNFSNPSASMTRSHAEARARVCLWLPYLGPEGLHDSGADSFLLDPTGLLQQRQQLLRVLVMRQVHREWLRVVHRRLLFRPRLHARCIPPFPPRPRIGPAVSSGRFCAVL